MNDGGAWLKSPRGGVRGYRIAAGVLACLLLAGCAAHPKVTAPQKPAAIQPRKIGSVVLVNNDLGFVVIEAISAYMPTAGQALKCFTGEKESGIVAVTPEAKRPLVAADIVSGQPQKGDDVLE